MSKLQKWWKPALVIVVLIIVCRPGCLSARTTAAHVLVTHLERHSTARGGRQFRRADSAESELDANR